MQFNFVHNSNGKQRKPNEMITTITEKEVEQLLDLTNRLIDACRGSKLFSEAELKDMTDLTYYFDRAFREGRVDLACTNEHDMDEIFSDDDDDDDDW